MTEQPTSAATVPRKRISGRSPSYPGITLQTAIKRAQELYEHEKTHKTPISVVTKYWGYSKHTTGPASVTYAALIKYGLMSDEGNGDARMAKLTPLAVTILMSPDDRERQEAIRSAALKPPIHAEMWQQYGHELPSDDTLRYKMAIQGPFTESGFEDFIRVYKDVIEFAKLGSTEKPKDGEEGNPKDGGSGDEENDEHERDESGSNDTRNARLSRRGNSGGRAGMTAPGVQTIAVPMLGAEPIIVEGKFPLTEGEWTYFLTVLNAMKSGLVGGARGQQRDDDGDE